MSNKLFKNLMVLSAVIGVLATSMSVYAAENYTVQKGDSLKKIAKQIYGEEKKWETIYEANKDSIKNPNFIYAGQIFTIPDSTNATVPDVAQVPPQTVDETAPSSETNAVTETVATPVPNVPVGTNPVDDVWGYKYIFSDGSYITCNAKDYMAETTDSYGVTYREYRQGANEAAIKNVANFIAQNPDSNFASMIQEDGDQFVIVTSNLGLADAEYDLNWAYDIVDCEPDDCVYLFVAGNTLEDGYAEEVYPELFNAVSDNITLQEY